MTVHYSERGYGSRCGEFWGTFHRTVEEVTQDAYTDVLAKVNCPRCLDQLAGHVEAVLARQAMHIRDRGLSAQLTLCGKPLFEVGNRAVFAGGQISFDEGYCADCVDVFNSTKTAP